ncbi:MAG: S1 RNA-binding domain-containing protein [Oscillospiraceae bacterium]|nr:S1 RNA-binding domain-containing protein [Oscillospiraceae bacterium]
MRVFVPEGALLDTQENERYLTNESTLRSAREDGQVLESRALLCDGEHNLHVRVGNMRGVIPRREGALGIDTGATRDVALLTRVNKPVQFMVEKFCGDTVYLSRKAVQSACCKEYLRTLRPGDILPATVTHLEPFGAFCDVGAGISALLPVSYLCVSRIAHPSARVLVGQNIHAAVKGIDGCGRITLTMKELLGSWEENTAAIHPGDTVPGIVRTVEPYGIFVELAPNLSGLAEYVPGVRPGMQASVFVKSIQPEKMKIKLVLVDAFFGESLPGPLQYFTQSGSLGHWVYSPPGCEKVVETVF